MVAHGIDGWELVEYDWNEETGVGSFIYAHDSSTETSPVLFMRQVMQPANEKHEGWHIR